jgi:spermidine synthase
MSHVIDTKKVNLSVTGFIGLIALSTLFYELSLIRILDVLWYPHFAYMVITLALLGFGIAGVITSILADRVSAGNRTLLALTLLLALSFVGIFFLLDTIHIDFRNFTSVFKLAAKVLIVFSGLTIPFFLSGLILSILFTVHAEQFGRLYFWDLVGASIGCLLVPLLIPAFGGPGLLFVASGFCLLAAGLLSQSRKIMSGAVLCALLISCFQLFLPDKYLEITYHMDKRGFRSLQGGNLGTYWDRISRIDLIQYRDAYIWIAYDGGTQTSYYYTFDGDYEKLRESLPEKAMSQFWDRYVFTSHWLKEGKGARVLVIGAAGGQETKAALTFGASSVDAVEMVGTVVRLGKEKYAVEPYANPKVNAVCGEGRSFLRSSNKEYDIIQMMSNHTSASVASGSGAVSPNYLQTTDAYKEYFSHLTENGVLHINHHIYPKMVLTAARAWKEMGLENFEQHVLLYYAPRWFNLPTLLIKKSPWTQAEFDRVDSLMKPGKFQLIHNPLSPETSKLAPEFFTGTLSREQIDSIPFRMNVPTDDQPFFNHVRKNFEPVTGTEPYVEKSIKVLLNESVKHGLPMDVIHLFVTAGAALVIAVVCLFGPLLFSKVGRQPWRGKASFIVYFACLGAGFITIELIFIQFFHKLVGFPLYTYASVVFAFLLSAGIGSYVTSITELHGKAWARFIPFLLIPLYGIVLMTAKDPLLNYFLQWSIMVRIAATVILIFPLGFFLGMPFALGIAGSHTKGAGAVGWAWAVNGLFTVLGSISCIVAAIYIGFTSTLLAAFATYLLAGVLLPRFSRADNLQA